MRVPRRSGLLLRLVASGVLATSLVLVGSARPAPAAPAARPPQARAPDPQPAISHWVFHYTIDCADIVVPPLIGVLAALPAEAALIVAVPGEADARHLEDTVDLGEGRVSFVLMERDDLTVWARDRYVCIPRGADLGIFVPPPESVVEGRGADAEVGVALRAVLGKGDLVTSDLAVEGGDLVMTADTAFVGVGTIRYNADALGMADQAVVDELGSLLGRRVVVLGSWEEMVHEHIDMLVCPVNGRRVLVADPRLVARRWSDLMARGSERRRLEGLGRFHVGDQHRLAAACDAIADQVRAAGYEPVRVPFVAGGEGGVVLTWVNAVTEHRAGRDRAYVPAYGLAGLDAEAHAVWRRLGYQVVPIDCTRPIQEGGGLRCLTNIVRLSGRVPRPGEPEAPPARTPVREGTPSQRPHAR